MFWALDERRKWRAKMRAEARAEGLAEGRAEGVMQGRAQGQAEAMQRYNTWLAKVAEEKGIALTDLLPPEEAPD
jgi:flagellar biosynthesis/type III secretory pathway protein FliH